MRLRVTALLFCLVACAAEHEANDRWIRHLALQGSKRLSASDALDGLANQKTPWYNPVFGKQWLDRGVLEADAQRIEAFYQEHGFFSAHVRGPDIHDRGDKSVDVTYFVDEGEETKVVGINIDGLDTVTDPSKARATIKIKIGDRFGQDAYAQALIALKGALLNQGYAYAKTEGEVLVDRPKHEATLHFTATPGPLVHFGKTTIHDSAPLAPKDLERDVVWSEGDLYTPKKVSDTQTKLYGTNTASEVNIHLPKEPTDTADVDIHVAPSKLRELRLGGGIGLQQYQQEVHLRLQYDVLNFFGGMRTLSLRLEPAYVFIPLVWQIQRSGPAGTVEARLVQPDIFRSRIDAFIVAGFDLGISQGYQYYGPRVQVGGERAFFSEHLRVGLSYNLQYLNFFNIDQAVFAPSLTPLGLGFRNPYRLAWLEDFVAVDFRDDRLDTHKGIYAELRAEQGFEGIGSQFTYLKFTPDVRGYVPIHERLTLALRATFGWLGAQTADDSPVTRRFFLGGPNSHRGFSVGRLSPQVYDATTKQNIPVGGNGMVLFSADLRVRVLRLAGYWLGLVTFADGGDVTAQFSKLKLNDLHYAVGESIAYETPIGVISAGLGVRLNRLSALEKDGTPNPDPCSSKFCGERFAFQLTIGASF